MFCDGLFGDLGSLVMGPLVMGRCVMGHFVMGHFVMGRFVCESPTQYTFLFFSSAAEPHHFDAAPAPCINFVVALTLVRILLHC
jgi:hypothetical protein